MRRKAGMNLEQKKLERINELARKSRHDGLTPEEKEEQRLLREEYIAGFRRGFMQTMESVVVVDEKGNRRKLKKKK